MKVVGPAGEMPWEFCGRVTYTLAGRNQSGNRNIPFSQFCSFPPSLQEISQFAGSREIGEVGGKGLLNTETPHSAQAVLELWEAEAGGDPGDCILHPSHGISAWLCWVLGGLDLFSGPVQPLSCSPQLLLCSSSKSWAPAGWEAGMRVGGVHHQIQKNSFSPSFATSSSKTDPCAQHFAQDGDHNFCFGVWIGGFYIFILFKLTHMAPESSP